LIGPFDAEENTGADQIEQIVSNQAQRTMVEAFFKEMLATTKDNQEATFRCLTVQIYGEKAMEKLDFLDKKSTCPCLLQRLCFMVADDTQNEREGKLFEEEGVVIGGPRPTE